MPGRVDAQQAGQQQGVDAFELNQGQHEGCFGQELFRAEKANREGVDVRPGRPVISIQSVSGPVYISWPRGLA
jgi:hypothetical protein